MISHQDFEKLYLYRDYPIQEKSFIHSIVSNVFSLLETKNDPNISNFISANPLTIIDYAVNEHLFKMQLFDKEQVKSIKSDINYQFSLAMIVADKITLNECFNFRPKTLVNKYHPMLSTATLVLNYMINIITGLEMKTNFDSLIIRSINTELLLSKSIIGLLIQGSETEAFSTWRTMHEVECTTKILFSYPYLADIYLYHIKYNTAYRDENPDKDEQLKLIQEIKSKLKEHGLKIKDMKKYIEYGWMYSIKDQETEFPDLKLNFRKGLEYVAGLQKYSMLYEMSSEIAHSSPLLIYSNKEYFKELTILALYETLLRIEEIFYSYIKNRDEVDLESYTVMRNVYIPEMKNIVQKEHLLYKTKFPQKEIIKEQENLQE